MLIAVLENKFVVLFIIIFGTLSFPTTNVVSDRQRDRQTDKQVGTSASWTEKDRTRLADRINMNLSIRVVHSATQTLSVTLLSLSLSHTFV